MTHKGRDIRRVELPASNIQYNQLFEMILVARWRGLSDDQFEALPPEQQARTIAAYRMAARIEAVQAQDATQSRRTPEHRPRQGRRR